MANLLAERELNVAQYIKNHPGITKAALVRDLKGRYSRATLFNVLRNLQNQKIITVEADKVNSQIHHLFANEDNIITNQLYELEQFERAFFSLLGRVREEIFKISTQVIQKLESYHNLQALKDATTIEGMNEIISDKKFNEIISPFVLLQGMFVHIFRQLLQLYTIRSIFIWPLQIEDTKKLDLISSVLFTRLVNIQLKMTKIIAETSSYLYEGEQFKSKNVKLYFPSDPKSMVTRAMLDNWRSIEMAQKYLESYGLQKETRPVIDLLSNIRNEIQVSS